jgi:N-methylhydantoinase A
LVATSAGGVATPSAIAHRAVATIGSGPTGGVVAAARAATAAGLGDVVSVDMGGTSYDVCLIRNGRPDVKADWNWRHRYCIALPMVDIHSIGAGGGSIARVVGGSLTVGPESAGSTPGPVCYGRGGIEPTVTDADLVLGRLDPSRFWGGRLTLDERSATDALSRLGKELGLDAYETAAAVVTIVDAHLTDAIRRVLSLAGADPRRLDLVAFGGMGGLHATTQAAVLGMGQVLVPDAAPGFSALGLLTADHVVDAMRTHVRPWRATDVGVLNDLASELFRDAVAELHEAGVPDERMRFEWLLNMVYPGQTFDSALPLARAGAGAPITMADVETAVEEFHRRNEAARLIEARAQEPTVRGIRLIATGLVPQPALAARPASEQPAPRTRRAFIGDEWYDEVPVFDGDALSAGASIDGPALIARAFTSVVLRDGDRAVVGDNGDLLISVAG